MSWRQVRGVECRVIRLTRVSEFMGVVITMDCSIPVARVYDNRFQLLTARHYSS